VRGRVVLDKNPVSLKDMIGFRCGNGEAVTTGLQLDRSPQGKLAITSVRDLVWPDEFPEAKESVEAGQELGEKEFVIMGLGM